MERTSYRRDGLLGVVAASAVACVALAVLGMPSAAAQVGGDNTVGGTTGGGAIDGGQGQISAWTFAYHALQGGGGQPIPCQLNGIPTIPAEFQDQLPDGYQLPSSVPGHIDFVMQGGGLLPDAVAEGMNQDAVGGTYVQVVCKPDQSFVELLPPGAGVFLIGWLMQLIDLLIDQNFQEIVFVPDGGPQMSLDAALQMLGLGIPTIITSPSQDVGGTIVGLDTWFAIDPSIWHDYGRTLSSTAAGATVTANIWAEPRTLTFDTGETVVPCASPPGAQYNGNAAAEHCGYPYRRANDGYTVTATATFFAGYDVSVGGGETAFVDRTGEATLTVAQAEAVVQE